MAQAVHLEGSIPSPAAPSLFDRAWNYADERLPYLCGVMLGVWGLQLFFPQPASFFFKIAALAFILGMLTRLPAAIRKVKYGEQR